MGRAIDMENDIDILNKRVSVLENQVRGMVSKIEEIEEGLDEIYEEPVEKKEVNNETEEKETDNEGDGKSSKPANSSKSKSSKKNK
tara:strand:- start:401 stop:658 length:258 start_codon:yes stop_codon:yes gene_type:complete